MEHTPVLLHEAIEALQPRPDRVYVDATLGGGGHARRLCQFLDETNTLVGIDQDPLALSKAKEVLQDCPSPLHLLHGNFSDLPHLLRTLQINQVDGGVLLDLGVSDFQIKTPDRGFSFRHAAPLDMRMDPSLPTTAETMVNTLSAQALADCFYRYADERLSRPIATAILSARPIRDTRHLAQIVEAVYRQKGVPKQKIHPATRVFQALRIAVNQELEHLEALLHQLPGLLAPGARVAIITFHSLEDRLVKQFFRTASASCICPPQTPVCTCNHIPTLHIVGRPVVPSPEEIEHNPQARSAKLRVAEHL